jgi:hypothetical protein
MYVRIEYDAVVEFPYLLGKLKQDNPNTSFPASIPEATLNSYGVFTVAEVTKPTCDYATHEAVENDPVLTDGVWTQSWSVNQRPTDVASGYVRNERNKRLADTDHHALSDTPAMATEMSTYRQALRDVPSQSGFPFSVAWPEKP